MSPTARPYPDDVLRGERGPRTYASEEGIQIAMPIGGIGAGCVCLNAYGGLQDFSIRHRPSTSAMPDGHAATDAAFALLHVKGPEPITRLVEGPLPAGKIYNLGLKAQGFREGGYEGMPRFRRCAFSGQYPVATARLSDPKVPIRVTLTAWNPLIPLDDKNSGIPCAILEYQLENASRNRVDLEFSYHLSHLAPGAERNARNSRNAAIAGAGAFLYNTDPSTAETFGSAALVVVGHRPKVKARWFRGGWFDSLSALWREVSEGRFRPNTGADTPEQTGRNGASVLVALSLRPGEKATVPVVIAWHFPNVNITYGGMSQETVSAATAAQSTSKWRPWYVAQWKDAKDVALYVRRNYASLRERTFAFREALFSTTAPSYVLEAVSANLGILKSPTVLRQESGNLWAWEGCLCDRGCCAGSCTHVWNYAQALPHLFPRLERTLREQELERSMDERGHVTFRAALPDGPTTHTFHAAADGQLGGIMKVYRDWRISGDRAWMLRMLPLAQRSLEYCIATWDPDRRGVLVEPHHNTYDIEFWGPDGMCSSIYLGALAAMAALLRDAGRPDEAAPYDDLARRGARVLDEELFDGEYFFQKVVWQGLRDTSFAERMATVDASSSEVAQLEKREGPKYQYATGCLSDGVLGAWMAALYGVETPQTRENVRKHLKAVFRYNFRADLSEHCCTQRPGYALGDDAGLVLCSWPKGGKPTLPFPYSDEVWTGIEYQVASHLIHEGFVAEGLTLVRAARRRHDGRKRNPWNEYECGSYYARAMSSYALLWALSGFRYDAPTQTLFFGPRLERRPFTTFFSTALGFGTITLHRQALSIRMVEGRLPVRRVVLTEGERERDLLCRRVVTPGKVARIAVR